TVGIISVLATSSLLSACSSGKEPDAGQTTDEGTKTKAPPKIHIIVSNTNNPYAIELKKDDPYVKELSRLSGYDLNFEFLGHEEYNKQLTVRFASGELADLIRTPSILS